MKRGNLQSTLMKKNTRGPTIIELTAKEDERGFLVKPFEETQVNTLHNIHIVSLNPGVVRGNHFHPTQTEYIIMLGKKATLVTIDTVTTTRSEKIIEGTKCPLIIIPPKVAHAIKNISTEVIYLFCYLDKPINLEREVIREVILT